MSNFLNSLKKGLNSAMSSRNEQVEIDQVIDELSKQMLLVSDNLVSIEVRDYSRLNTNKTGKNLSALFSREEYKALTVLWEDEEPKFQEVAEWAQDEEGYPVKILWKNVTHTCTNRGALEIMLMKIVEDASFGIIFRDIVYASGKKIISEADGPKVASTVAKKRVATRKS